LKARRAGLDLPVRELLAQLAGIGETGSPPRPETGPQPLPGAPSQIAGLASLSPSITPVPLSWVVRSSGTAGQSCRQPSLDQPLGAARRGRKTQPVRDG